MKNKFLKTLTGIVLATALTTNIFGQKKEINYNQVEGSINGTEYSDKKLNKIGYNLENQILFDKKTYPFFKKGEYDTRTRNYFYNEDLEQGELEFVACLRDEINPVGSTTSGKIWAEKRKEYIPTKLVGKNGKPFTEFELYDIPEKIKRRLTNVSKNSFGHNETEKANSKGGILPEIEILQLPYLYLDGTKGRFIQRDKNGKIIETKVIYAGPNILPEIYILLNQEGYNEFINFDCGNIKIISEEGFFLPVTEKLQKNQSDFKKEKIQEPEKEKKDYENTKKDLKKNCTGYIVKPGDNLTKLSEKFYGTPKEVDEILKLNPQIKNPDDIKIGQKLKICPN